MYCPECGEKQRENAKFCAKCGADLRTDMLEISDLTEEETEDSSFRGQRDSSFGERIKGHKPAFFSVLAVAAGVVLIVGIFSSRSVQNIHLQDFLEAGIVYLEEGDYEEAVAALQSAIEIDPKVIESYDMLEEAYLALGDTEAAAVVHQQGEDARNNQSGNAGQADSRSKKSSDPGTAIQEFAVNEENVQNLLQTFSVSTLSLLQTLYEEEEEGTNIFSSEELSDEQVYVVAALALIESEGEDLYNTSASYCYWEDAMVPVEDLSEEQLQVVGDNRYVQLPEEVYEQYICDLFGNSYLLEDFVEYESDRGVLTRQDEEGQFYLKVVEVDSTSVQMEMEPLSEPDEEGVYQIHVKYTEETKTSKREYYMQFQIVPDESSQYGCCIKEMIPVGMDEEDI